MATRREVREAFYSELETAASGHVSGSNISEEEPDSDEDLPAIVHNDSYRHVPMNTGAAPTDASYTNGVITSITFTRQMEARFVLTILSDDEQEKEDAYEAVRSYFEDYTHNAEYFPDPSDIQSDVSRVQVTDSNPSDMRDREPIARGDTLRITLQYGRDKTFNEGTDFEAIDEVEHNVDADNDGTTDETYTTT